MSQPTADAAARCGMSVAAVAADHPERLALRTSTGTRTFAALNARANQVARRLRRAGLVRGDVVALLARNRLEFAEVVLATQRTGLRLTPLNWHLAPADVAYVVHDSGARALIADAACRDAAGAAGRVPTLVLRLAVAGAIDGFEDYEEALAGEDGRDVEDPCLGDTMLYTSGTTGRPKGVRRALPDPARAVEGWRLVAAVFGFRPGEDDVTLATGPLYHSGPLNLCLAVPLASGIPTVLMDRWDAETMLQLIDRHRVTHTYCVPTMFHRLLALPAAVRARYDLSSLRFVVHGAAPCPVPVKRAMIEWLGPVVTEIYAATEGMGTMVTAEEWLERPGTVGRPLPGQVRIVDAHGDPLPAGEIGTVFLRPLAGADFEYHGDAIKTAGAKRDGCFTVGDMGYLDDAGYLFLSGRSAEVVITGGTNVYPAEIDAVLLGHPAVQDAAAVGIPDAEWGEVVAAAVVPAAGAATGDDLAERLRVEFRARLPTHQAPRVVRLVDEIPRSDAGKILRRELGARLAGARREAP